MTTAEGKKLILVVDDEPDLVTYLTTFFEDNGYATDSAKDGVEAMEKIKEEIPDLITLDISIPEKSGVKVYRELKENPEYTTIPVFVITGVTGYGGDPAEFEKFISSRKQVPPPEGFIAKPIDRGELLKKMQEIIG